MQDRAQRKNYCSFLTVSVVVAGMVSNIISDVDLCACTETAAAVPARISTR